MSESAERDAVMAELAGLEDARMRTVNRTRSDRPWVHALPAWAARGETLAFAASAC